MLVVVWTQDGCPACEEYHPTFVSAAAHYQNCVPSVVVKADEWSAEADRYFISGTPTTTLLRYGRRTFHTLNGPATAEQIDHYFQVAMRLVRDCQL